MAQKLYGLTPAELARLQRAIRYIEDNASMYRPYRRIRGQQAGGGTGIRHAYCKTAAGAGNTIQCYLDTNLTGQEIAVQCDLVEAVNLSTCVPLLTTGRRIPVFSMANTWYCLWWFNGVESCND